MKREKKLLMCVLFSLFTITYSFAQVAELKSKSENKAKDNWFVSLGGGANVYHGEQDGKAPFSDRIGYSGEISVGKWFTPAFGARIQFYGGIANGWNYGISQGGRYIDADRRTFDNFDTKEYGRLTGLYDPNNLTWIGDPTMDPKNPGVQLYPGEMFKQEIKHVVGSIDLMFNLTTLFRGYHKDDNFIDLLPFAGVGLMRGFGSDATPKITGVAGKLGLRANFNVAKNIAIYLEAQANALDKDMDGYFGNRIMDAMYTGMAGINFTINKNFKEPQVLTQEEIDRINRKLNQLNEQIEELQARPECKECPPSQVTAPTVIIEKELYLPEYIRFSLAKSDIINGEADKINMAVKYLNENPQAKVLLIGYADRKTGNPAYNMKLSERRVRAVVQALVDRGISESRLFTEWKGDKEQPYKDNEWNRVVILVER